MVRSALTGYKRLTRSLNWCTIFWPRKPQKIHLQVRGHACCLVFHVWSTAFCHVSKIGKRWLSQLPGYGGERNGVSQVLRAVVQHQIDRQVRREKRLTVALYLDELLIKYVNSKVDRSSFSHHGFPPVGPWHLVGATMDNTLD